MNRAISKYWITAVMLGLVIVFAFLYLQPGWKMKGDPKFRLVTLEGDPKASSDLSVRGSYQYSRNFSSRIKLNEDGIVHEKDLSIYEQTFDPWLSANLVKDSFDGNLDFLRGKKNYGTFYADDEMLAYANTELIYDDWVLQLSVYDKSTKRQSDFEVAYPDSNSRYYWSTDAIQRTEDGQIIVFSTHRKADVSDETQNDRELVRLQIDVGQKVISDVTTIIAGKDEDYQQFGILNSARIYTSMPYMLMSAPANGKWDYYAYQISTGKLVPIVINRVPKDEPTLFDVEGDRLDFAYSLGTSIHLQSFDMATGQPATEELVIDSAQWNATFARVTAVNEQTVSIVYHDMRTEGVALIDRNTGRVNYRGEVQADGTEQEQQQALRKFDLLDGFALNG